MTGRMIRVEAGTHHALAWCAECPPWRELRGTRAAALTAAAEHADRCHHLPHLASDLRRQARRAEARRAEAAGNPPKSSGT